MNDKLNREDHKWETWDQQLDESATPHEKNILRSPIFTLTEKTSTKNLVCYIGAYILSLSVTYHLAHCPSIKVV